MFKKIYTMMRENLPFAVRLQIATVAAYMTCIVLSIAAGSYMIFGALALVFTSLLVAAAIMHEYMKLLAPSEMMGKEKAEPKIMIIDDDALTAMTYAKFLEKDHIAHHTVTDPRKAMQDIATHKPDLILMDILMPHLSGYDIAAKIHQTYPEADRPDIIFMTGALKETETDYTDKSIENGGILLKPLHPKQMSNVIDIRTRQKHRRVA